MAWGFKLWPRRKARPGIARETRPQPGVEAPARELPGFPRGRPSFAEQPVWLKLLAWLVLLLLMLPGTLALLLSSEATSRWAFAQASQRISGLELAFERGDFWRGWHFARIAWHSDGLQLDIDRLELDWSPGCLLSGRVCVDRLYSRRLTVITAASEAPADSGPLRLPDIRLPLAIRLGDVTLEELSLDGETTLLRNLHLATGTRRGRLLIREFSGAGPELSWHLQGTVAMYGEWPLNLKARVQLPPVDERDWELDISLGGTLERLALQATSSGYLSGQLQGQLEPFQPGLPASLQWQGESFFPYTGVPETLTLDDWTVTAGGNFDSGFMVEGRSALPHAVLPEAWQKQAADEAATAAAVAPDPGTPDMPAAPLQLELSGLVTTASARNIRLLLSIPGNDDATALLTGHVDWSEQLDVEARLGLQHFPWQRLYPLDTGAVTLQTLQASFSLVEGQLAGQLEASVTGEVRPGQEPQPVALSAKLSGDWQALEITPLSVTTAAGSVAGKVSLNFAEGIAWQGDLQIHDLNPGVLYADFPGQLNGSLFTRGRSRDDQLQLEALWDIAGQLRKEQLALQGKLSKPDASWVISDLQLRQGENSVTGRGQWGPVVDGAFDVRLDRLHSLVPGLHGKVHGRLGLSGSAERPAAALSATAEKLRQGEFEIGNARLNASGTVASHRLQLSVSDGQVALNTHLRGGLSETAGSGDKVWQGQLSDSRVEVSQLAWQLQQAVSLRYQLQDGLLQLGGHCWAHDEARLCFNGQQTLLPERKVDVALSDFDLATLSGGDMEWMPEDLLWDARLDASLKLTQAAGAAPVADVRITSTNGEIRKLPGSQPLPPAKKSARSVAVPESLPSFPYEVLDISAWLEPATATTRVQIASDTLGQLDINTLVRDPAGKQTLDGSYRLQGFKLGFLQPFLPQVSRLEGELNGQGQIRGSLRQPDVGGTLILSGGHISGESLPVSLEQLAATVSIRGQRAEVDGHWQSGERGTGQLQGHVAWAPLEVELALTGAALPLTVVPYAQVYISPDLRIGLRDNALEVTGAVAIPEGKITVADLPRSAVQVSPDAVIMGEETAVEDNPLGISARVQLLVGDRLQLDAFGLTGRLAGQLEVRENLTATGDLRLLGGAFQRLGQDLKLRRAILLFAGPISQPYLNVEAVREVDDVVAGLRLSGSALNPESQVFSEPAMSQEEALSYLLLGRGLNEDTSGEGDFLAQAALSLGVAGSALVSQKVASSLGVKDFELETAGRGDATQVVASGSITDRLSLRYGVGVFDSSSEIGVRYELTRRLYIEAVSGFVSSLDFFYRIDF